ncbi:winged helix-turn-helix domain-containing protein [Haloferax namakaokahaiae]|uniref:Winged helix-turn-helix domain-containing protein n=1 Tax=Haloferax namakaokahaiae TaxID=1748331 RepID=A0ABD5ZJ04_9EURY
MAGRKPTVSDEEIISIFKSHEDPFLSTSEVAEELGFSQQGTLKRLQSLEKDGVLQKKKAGGSLIWWLVDLC